MLKGGLLPSPIITPLSSSPLASKNKIHTQTFVEIRSDVSNVRIYFTVDGTKPDPFQIFRTGTMSTYLYRGAFRLGEGRRVVKAIAVTNNGVRESNITTRFFDVNDKYSENRTDSGNENLDDDLNLPDYQQNKNHLNLSKLDDSLNSPGNFEDSIVSVNYPKQQANIWRAPDDSWGDRNRDVPYEYIREQVIERLPPPAPIPAPLPIPPRIPEPTHDEENFWNRKAKPLSPGNGNWKKTLEHLFLNIYNYVKDEQQLQELFGWKIFGRMESIYLIDKGSTYQVLSTFKKPLGEQTCFEEPPLPTRKRSGKHRPKKRTRTPPDTNEEKYVRQNYSFQSPIRHAESKHEERQQNIEEKQERTKVYTANVEEQGTLIQYDDFDADTDCKILHKAIIDGTTDVDVIFDVLGNRSSSQRMNIFEQYKSKFRKNLDEALKSNVSRSCFKVLKNLLYLPVEYDCYELERLVKHTGTNEEAIIEILASRSHNHLQDINDTYRKLFEVKLETDILNSTCGHLKTLLTTLLKDRRSESNEINERSLKEEAKQLYEADEDKWGTIGSKFIEILCRRSNVELKFIFEAYRQFSSRDIEADIKSETTGGLRTGLLAIVRIMRNRPKFFAYHLNEALEDAGGVNEDNLNRIIISRCEIDMIQIKEEYENLAKRSLEDHIQKSTKEDYRQILLELLKDPKQRFEEKRSSKARRKHSDRSTDERSEGHDDDSMGDRSLTRARNFDGHRDSDLLRKAMEGRNWDVETIIDILGNLTSTQRSDLAAAYKIKFNRVLTDDLRSKASDDLSLLLERLMLRPVELDCFELKQAVDNLDTDKQVFVEIFATRDNERITDIKKTYPKMYSNSLEKDIESVTSGDFHHLLATLLKTRRPGSAKIDSNQIKKDAQSLMHAKAERFKTYDSVFNDLYCKRSDAQLKAIFDQFENQSKETIEKVVQKETKGDLQKGILAVLECIRDRSHYFAEQINRAIEDGGNKEQTLSRIILTRSEIDLGEIRKAYKAQYHRELERDVDSSTNGAFQKLLLKLLKGPYKNN